MLCMTSPKSDRFFFTAAELENCQAAGLTPWAADETEWLVLKTAMAMGILVDQLLSSDP